MRFCRAFALILCAITSPLRAQFNIVPVAVTGQAAPGGGTFTGFSKSDFVFNRAGQLTFLGSEKGADGTNTSHGGVWLYGGSSPRLVARAGADPGAPPAEITFGSLTDLTLGSNGHIGIGAFDLSGRGAVWAGLPGSIQKIATAGDPVAGLDPPVNFGPSFYKVEVNTAGRVAFYQGDQQTSSTDTRAIWIADHGSVSPLAIDRAAAPGTSTTFYDVTWPLLSDSGKAVFQAFLNPFVAGQSVDSGIWTGSPGSLQLVAASGNVAPGTGGLRFSKNYPDTPVINSAGVIAFHGSLDGTPNRDGIWMGTPGFLQLVARSGDHAPGTALQFSSITNPVINDRGDVIFRGIAGDFAFGIWGGPVGQLRLLAVNGAPVPEAGAGVTIKSSGIVYQINNNGQAFFDSFLSVNGPAGIPSRAFFVADPGGSPHLVLREGDFLPVGAGYKQIQELWFQGGVFDNTLFTDAGQFAFYAAFTDGTQSLFVATVPEPSSLAVLVVASACTSFRRRRIQ